MYAEEIKILSALNPDDIKEKSMKNREKLISEEVVQLSKLVVNEINENADKGRYSACIDVADYMSETRKIVLKELKKKWKAKIYTKFDYGLYINLKVKW